MDRTKRESTDRNAVSDAPLPIEVPVAREAAASLRRDNYLYRVTVPGAKRRHENAGRRF
jgi:hypothetical protein